MRALARAGDPTTGHDGEIYPPTIVTGGSSKVTIQGKPALNKDNLVHVEHCKVVYPYDCHSGSLITFSTKVLIEGASAVRVGDTLSCGDVIASGSTKVSAS